MTISTALPSAEKVNKFLEENGSDHRVYAGAVFTMEDYVAIHEILIRKELDRREGKP